MPYAASSAAGTLLYISASSPVSYSFVEGVEGLQVSGAQKNTIDVTAISDSAKKFIPDLPDFGSMSFNLFWDPDEATHIALKTNFDNNTGAVLYFKTVMDNAGASEYLTQGFVTGWAPSHSKGNANMLAVEIKLTGSIVVTA